MLAIMLASWAKTMSLVLRVAYSPRNQGYARFCMSAFPRNEVGQLRHAQNLTADFAVESLSGLCCALLNILKSGLLG
jgi:hypothetical protein